MTGKQLKNSILQWAIQGKLVPQDPNDEPASVLLEKIRQEKERLIKEKKIKRDKNASIIFRGEDNSYYEKFLATGEVKCIDEEIPFEMPQGWEWCRVSSVFLINPKVSAKDDDIAAFIPMEAISAGYGSEFRFYEKQWKEVKSGYTAFEDNDIAFAKITPCFQNRKSVIFNGLPNGIGAGTTELKILRTYGETINRYYALYFLESPYFIDEATFKGTANQQRIVVGYLENKLFPLPPLSEQKRIVDKIGIIMPFIDKYSKFKETLDKINVALRANLKKSILQEAIQGKLVPQIAEEGTARELLEQIRQEKERLIKEKKIKRDKNASIIFRGEDNSYYEKFLATGEVKCIDEEIPFEIPQGWEWCRFSSIYWQLTDGTHSTPKYTQSGIPFLSVKDMSTGRLSFANTKFISEEEHKLLSQRCHPCKGNLLLSKVGTTGIPLIIDDDREFSIFVSLALIKFFPKFVDSSFLIALLNSPLVQMQVKEDTRGVGNKNWVLTAISNTLLAIPPLREQQRIVEKIDILSPYTDKIERLFEQLK